MASASSRRTLDTDYITLRKIFARYNANADPPSTFVLTSAGDGTTFWTSPSTLGNFPTFQEFQTDVETFLPSTSRTIELYQGSNVYMSTIGSNNLMLTTPLFRQIDISGSGSLYAFSNSQLNGTFKVAGQGFVSSITDTTENIVYISSTRQAPTISTNPIFFQQLKIQSTVTSPLDLSPMTGNALFIKNDFYSMPSLIGQQDFVLRPTVEPLQVQFELSSYSAKGYLALSTNVATTYLSTLSTLSSIYIDSSNFSIALQSLSTTEGFNASTSRSTIDGFSNYTQVTYNNKMGDTLARATIIQLNDAFGLMNVGLSTVSSAKTPVYVMVSTNKGVENLFSTPTTTSISTYTNFFAGSLFNFTVNVIYGVSTYFSTLSTQMNSNYEGFSNANVSTALGFIEFMKSTTAGLGTINYVSSASLQSSLRFQNTFGQFISTTSLVSTTLGLTSTGYVNQPQFLSGFSINYTVYPNTPTVQTTLISSTKGTIENAPYISTLSFTSSLVSTTAGIPVLGLETYTDNSLLKTSLLSTAQGIPEYSALNFGYISSLSFISTLTSTTQHLGTAGYLSSAAVAGALQSTLEGLVFWTSDQLASTISGSNEYIRDANLESTSRYFLGWRGVFKSSIRYQGTPQYENISSLLSSALVAPPGGYFVYGYFSTFSYFSLNDFFPYIRESSRVVLEYSPCIMLTRVDLIYSNTSNYFKTQIVVDDNKTPVPNGLYQDSNYWYAADVLDLQPNSSNFYRRNMTFSFSGSEIQSLYNKQISFLHSYFIGSNIVSFVYDPISRTYVPQNCNYFMFRDQTFTNLTATQGSLFVSIYN